MRLCLINPSNPLVSIVNVSESRWNRYRVWKPLSLMVLAGMTSPEWEVTIVDENLGLPDYPAMPRPDLVGITAFTSQAQSVLAALDRASAGGSLPALMVGVLLAGVLLVGLTASVVAVHAALKSPLLTALRQD